MRTAIIRIIFVPATLLLVAVLATTVVGDSRFASMRLMSEAMLIVDRYSFEDAEPEELFNSAWNGMSEILDPHTNFIPAESYRFVSEENQGSFQGIGVEITVRDGLVTVISPIAGSHAEEVGLRPGDQVIAVDSVDVTDMPSDEVTSRIRGPAGTTVLIRIRRPGMKEPFEVEIERRNVEISSVQYSGVIDSVGYIHLSRFSLTSPYEFSDALELIMSEDLKGLVIDLRGNPGGFMSGAIFVAGLFLPDDKLIVATKSRREWENYSISTTNDGPLTEIPLAVLVSGGSASASEIVAGALQDHDRAVIIGDTTFGKGLVQTNIMLPGDNAFRVTTSKYYLPSGRLIQKFAEADWAENMQISREEINTAYRTDAGRSVYGGGGIAPDIPMVRDSVSVLSTMLTYGNYFFRFAVDYRAQHGDSIPQEVTDEMLASFREYVYAEDFEYPNFVHEQLDSLRVVLAGIDDRAVEKVLASIRAKAVQLEEDDWRQSRGFIRDRLCERFANLRGGREEVYGTCRLRNDEQIQTAVEIVSDTALYNSILRPE